MNINDLLLKYRKPLFNAEGEGGGGAPAPVADAAPADAAAPADDAPQKTMLTDDAPKDDGAPADDAAAKDEGSDKDKADGDDGEGDDATPTAIELTAPEGMENFQGDFDKFASEATGWIAENPKATAADALKWAASRQADTVAAQNSAMTEAFSKQITTWETEAKADPDMGGDAFEANLATAKLAVDAFGDGALKSVLAESGLGSHPAILKFAFNAGKSLADAGVIKPNASSDGSALKSRYDKS